LSGRPRTRAESALVTAVFLVSLALRVAAVDRPLNIDEALWIQRGALFMEALDRHDAHATYLRPHPGVTTMWLVGLSNAAWCYSDANGARAPFRACVRNLAVHELPPLVAYVAPRLVQAVVTAAALSILIALAVRVFGLRVALPAAALLTFEPFFLAYQRFITTDALAADLASIAVLLFLLYLRDGRRRLLFTSGIAFGLAAATKVSVLTMAAPMWAWVVVAERGYWPRLAARGMRARIRDLAAWAGVALVVVVVIWPAARAEPLRTASTLLSDLRREVEPVVGRGDDPRWWFYARVLAWRFTPALQGGALLAAIALAAPAWRRSLVRHEELEALFGLTLGTFLLLRLAADAGLDRYLLPIVPPLALVAGAGWAHAGDWLSARLHRGWIAPLVSGGLAIGQLASLAPHLPGGMTYFNPLLGGASAARDVLPIGMGEGLELAAEWLNEQPGSESLVVATGCAAAFAPYFKGKTVDITPTPLKRRTLGGDRVVVYVREELWLDPVLLLYLDSQPPLHVVTIHGVDYAKIYRGPIAVPDAWRAFDRWPGS